MTRLSTGLPDHPTLHGFDTTGRAEPGTRFPCGHTASVSQPGWLARLEPGPPWTVIPESTVCEWCAVHLHCRVCSAAGRNVLIDHGGTP